MLENLLPLEVEGSQRGKDEVQRILASVGGDCIGKHFTEIAGIGSAVA